MMVRADNRARAAHDPGAVLAKAALSAAKRLGLGNRQLGRILGSSEASVSRLHRERALRPAGREAERLHYLRFTSFRYPPLRRGSRFGSRGERGIWYGAESLRAAFAEVAYYRMLFLEGTQADLGSIDADLTAFTARVKTKRGVDLTASPFDHWRAALASKTSYAATQPLGSAMREAAVEAFRYVSA